MILTCPECSTNYMAKDGSIGPNGRSVTCARCDTTWFVPGIDPDAMALEDIETVLITPEAETQPDLPFSPDVGSSAPVGAHILLRDKADAEKLAKRRREIRLIWAVPIILLVVAGSAAILKRQAIVGAFPRTATLYQAVGFDVKANGLDIRNLKSERLIVDGEPVLRVTGEVVNLTKNDMTAPLVQLRLGNRSGEPLADWFVEAGTVEAGQSVKIETDYPAPPIDSIDLNYRFVPDE